MVLMGHSMMTGIWEQFLLIIKEEYGSRVVETWFKAVCLVTYDVRERVIYLRAPNVFVRDWILRNYLPIIQTNMGRLLNVEHPKILFVDQSSEVTVSEPQKIKASAGTAVQVVPAAPLVGKEAFDLVSLDHRGLMNKTYSFDTFVVGPHNSLAYAAAHAVTENPGQLYNPLFIYGGSGLGKTHLLHSIGNGIRAKNKTAAIVYQSTDRFVSEFINAIRFNKMHKFQAKYKNVDALLIDDVQFISNKEQTQEAFFHIFNMLYESHKQIVLSSDTVPNNIKGLAERLRSRLAWGLVADIQQPSLETKIAIVKKKAELSNENIEEEVCQFIAARTVSNVRELEGALIRVVAFASLTKQPISLQLAKRVLVRVPEERVIHNDFDAVIQCINKYYSYKIDDLRSKSRSKEISLARQVAMFLMKKVTNKSLRDIGEFLGGRDHSTVMHAISRVEEYAQTHAEFHHQLQQMEQESLRL